MKSRPFVNWIIFLISLFGLCSAFASQSPAMVVKEGVTEVVSMVQDKSLEQGVRRDMMRTSIANRFDFNTMSRSILARNWKKADAEQQRRFVVLLRTLLEDTYMTAIESYTSEQINFGDEKIKGKKAVVNVSILLTSGAEAPLLFKLRNKGGDWFVYDVVIEGVSLVSTFRSNFSSIVKRDGVDGLLERLEQKMKQS